jgi:hypothetical protein
MKKIVMAAAGLMLVAQAHAAQPEYTLVEVEMTPVVEKPALVAKWDSRFGPYAIENVASSGEQQ